MYERADQTEAKQTDLSIRLMLSFQIKTTDYIILNKRRHCITSISVRVVSCGKTTTPIEMSLPAIFTALLTSH